MPKPFSEALNRDDSKAQRWLFLASFFLSVHRPNRPKYEKLVGIKPYLHSLSFATEKLILKILITLKKKIIKKSIVHPSPVFRSPHPLNNQNTEKLIRLN